MRSSSPPVPAARSSRSSDQRKAASVFPEPVGAAISVSAPRAMAGQPAACAGVGVPKRSSNQRATSGEKATATSDS